MSKAGYKRQIQIITHVQHLAQHLAHGQCSPNISYCCSAGDEPDGAASQGPVSQDSSHVRRRRRERENQCSKVDHLYKLKHGHMRLSIPFSLILSVFENVHNEKVKIFLQRKSTAAGSFTGEFYQSFKEQIILNLMDSSRAQKRGDFSLNHSMRQQNFDTKIRQGQEK